MDVYNVPSTSTEHVISKLRESFAVQGLSDEIVSDNATCFTSEEYGEFLKKNGIKPITSAPYHPASNGAAERAVQNFKQTMRKLTTASEGPVATHVSRLLFAARHTPSSVTGVSPAEMMFKHKPQTRLSRLKPDVSTSWRKAAERMVKTRLGSVPRDFQVGERVTARNYSRGGKWVAGVILEKTGPVSYKVQINGGIIRRHVDQLRMDGRTEDVKRDTCEAPTVLEHVPESQSDRARHESSPVEDPSADTVAPDGPSELAEAVQSEAASPPRSIARDRPRRDVQPPDRLGITGL